MKLTPYLIFDGNAEEALNFYANVLEGQIVSLQRYGETPVKHDADQKDKILHSRLAFGENVLMVSDGFKGYRRVSSDNIQLSVEINDPEKQEAMFHKMAIDGNITMPLADQFWGARFGMLTDKFGVRWMFNCEIKK